MEDVKNYSKDLKEILDYVPDGNLVISVFLRVDISKVLRQDYITSLNSMITEARSNIDSNENIAATRKHSGLINNATIFPIRKHTRLK